MLKQLFSLLTPLTSDNKMFEGNEVSCNLQSGGSGILESYIREHYHVLTFERFTWFQDSKVGKGWPFGQ